MIGLLDLALLSAHPGTVVVRQGALDAHQRWLRRCAMHILWREEFACDLPWGDPCARDVCTAVSRLLEHLRGNDRLLFLDEGARLEPVGVPAWLTDGYSAQRRAEWLDALARAVRGFDAERGMAVLTWPRQEQRVASELPISLPPATEPRSFSLLRHDEDWHPFFLRYHRPDLSSRHVVVLGGRRAQVERAGKSLQDVYRLRRFRYLPPAYEQNRSKKDTLDALEKADLLVVCTNRLKHSDTDHLKGQDLPCARLNLDADTAAAIEGAVVLHFRQIERGG